MAAERALELLIRLFLKAERQIIAEITALRSRGLVDYHAQAALERVQRILMSLEDGCWQYVPQVVERQFYIHHPEARRIAGETAKKHLHGYLNAGRLTSEQYAVADQLVNAMMDDVSDACATVTDQLAAALIGRPERDLYRTAGLTHTALRMATGSGTYKELPDLVQQILAYGVTAFIDKAGRRWSLTNYGAMVSRTTARQAEVMAVLTADPGQDLYRITQNGTSCPLCAPYEGRVYSKSGKDPHYPPLSDAFGKRDPDGPDTLANSWLNIHPNCLHALVSYTEAGRTPEEIREIRNFSSPAKNPYTVDPRTRKQIEAYRNKERARAKYLRDYRQWERYREALGDSVPSTFQTFQKHKYAVQDPKTKRLHGDEKYLGWMQAYRRRF